MGGKSHAWPAFTHSKRLYGTVLCSLCVHHCGTCLSVHFVLLCLCRLSWHSQAKSVAALFMVTSKVVLKVLHCVWSIKPQAQVCIKSAQGRLTAGSKPDPVRSTLATADASSDVPHKPQLNLLSSDLIWSVLGEIRGTENLAMLSKLLATKHTHRANIFPFTSASVD